MAAANAETAILALPPVYVYLPTVATLLQSRQLLQSATRVTARSECLGTTRITLATALLIRSVL